jgi:hypothetical protein
MSAPSDIHEEIVNDVWEIFQTDVVNAFGSAFDEKGILFSLCIPLSNMLMGIADPKNRMADFYFDPYDGHGPVVGEVGEMKSDKWADINSPDGAPIRILRVGFDRSIGLINPRFSIKKIEILKIVQDRLWHIRFENEI